jgi:phosphocarrier protein FPr
MIGFVIVSHSAKLAEGVCELAEQVSQGRVCLASAGGTSDPQNPIGTDAFKVLDAIHSVYSEDGVLVLMDLGSAVLSAETAFDLLEEQRRAHVRLCSAPLVEGTVAAVSQAAAGATFEEIVDEAESAMAGKGAPIAAAQDPEPAESMLVTVRNPPGLHARPAAQLVRLVRRFAAHVWLENLTTTAGPVAADSINGVLGLDARQGHRLRIQAQGPVARRTLAELAAFIESGCGEAEEVAAASSGTHGRRAGSPNPGQLVGIPASSGIAIGPLFKLLPAAFEATARVASDPEAEWQRLQTAIHSAQEETRSAYEWARAHIGDNEADIFDAQLLFLQDPEVNCSAAAMVLKEQANAEFAWQAVTAERATHVGRLDVADIAARVLRKLTGLAANIPHPSQPAILSAHDLTPSDVKEFDPHLVLGLCLEAGSANAHSVILARALGIPTVAGLGPEISALADGTTLAIDGGRGLVWVSPGADEVHKLEDVRHAWLAERRAAHEQRHRPAATRDGRRIRVYANVSGVAEAGQAMDLGAEGIGVLRTEFLFLARPDTPGEAEQFAAYRAIAEQLEERPLTIRTFDAGGDKRLPYIDTGEEANPFLGWRGIRVALSRRDLFKTQLRAILRAGYGHAVEILLPMISSADEVREAKALLRALEAELTEQGLSFRKDTKMGVMMEVPAAVAVADQLAREASFFSIGSNDLIQYVMAADRTNARVAPIADPFQPAVVRMIQQAIDAGRRAGIAVALCGELAADRLATPLLLGLGLEEFSVSVPLIPELKRAISQWGLDEAAQIASQALALDSNEAVRELLTSSAR